MLDLIDIVGVFELVMILHFIFVILFEKDDRVKLVIFALVVYSLAAIFITIEKFNPF